MLAAQPWLAQSPRGDGHPVLVVPCFLGGDLSTQPLRTFLVWLGYRAMPWGLGVNLGPRPGVMDACLKRLEQLYAAHGRRVSLIGWSLGGLYVRELAKEVPERVRLVITLGSPFAGQRFDPSALWRLQGQLTGESVGLPLRHGPLNQAPPVPTTSILSRSDGIVHWTDSLEHEGPITENILVESSHLGLVFHPLCLHAIADRLAQPEGAWRPFERTGARAWLYPAAPHA
ncbi:MAG: alpha/beta hydrolase [Thermochromatium sp.]